MIKLPNYGNSIIVMYKFLAASNSAQQKVYIIFNSKFNEFSIWDFENIEFGHKLVTAEFNIRGKLSYYSFKYPHECAAFQYISN